MEAAIKEKASYQRRTPENTLLYKVLQENLETFLELCRLDGKGMPKHVEEELKAFLRCGILQYGFLRLKCTSCEHESVCAFSCKKRGFCPSCNGKRMAETAEHLVENILPIAPYRQYVVAFPIPLRFWMATNKKLLAKIHKIVIDCLHCYLIDKAKSIGIKNAHPGSVTFIQRFGGSLNLHPHLHILVMDGVYTDHEKPRFAHLKSPTENEINDLIQTIAKKIIKHLRKKGYIKEEPDLVNNPYVDPLFADHPAWTNALAHSIENKIAFGENAGKYLRRIHSGFGYQEERPVVKSKLCSSINGFSVHANVSVNALQRQELEKLIRYLARPSLSSERLSMNKKDEIIYELKNAWDDGTKFVLFTKMELIERLCALIPPPKAHLIRYSGILAPHCNSRKKIILKPEIKRGFHRCKKDEPKLVKNYSWSRLLKRCFKVDVDKCPKCHADMQIMAALQDPLEIQRYLKCVGQETRAPPISPAKIDYLELTFE